MKSIASISLPRLARGTMMRGFFDLCSSRHENSHSKQKDLRGLAREQVGFDEVVDVSAEHSFDISSFKLCACVFH